MSETCEIPVGAQGEYVSALVSKAESDNEDTSRDKTLVIMSHDFPGARDAHEDLYGDLEFLFNQSGFSTIRFDFRGCGASEGQEGKFNLSSALEDFRAVLDWADKQEFEKLIYVGEGLGASIAMQLINDDVIMLMLFWPVVDLPAYARTCFEGENFVDDFDLTGYIEIGGNKIGLSLISEMLDADPRQYYKDLKIPVLIQYGVQDDTNPALDADLLKDNLKARRIDVTSYQDGNRGLTDDRHRKMVFFHIGQFIEKYA